MTQLIDRLRHRRMHRAGTGAHGERAAASMLRQAGYKILARNLRNRFGEIDLIVLTPDRRTVVIVEVKTAQAADALPEVRVDHRKQRRLTALAAQAVRRYRLQDHPIRFDVVAVNLPPGAKPVVRHHRGAFGSCV